MKNNTIKKVGLKSVFVLSLALAGFNAQAQSQTADITKQGATTMGQIGNGTAATQGSVRVIDNKGTIKYLQVKNGITQITNTAADKGIVTTWQLGGTLTDDTYIDATGKVFGLDGLKLVTTQTVSVNATDGSTHTTATGTGYTFLVRDEATGETLKLMPSQLVVTGAVNQAVTANATDMTYTDPAFLPSAYSKVSVYRNGAKLLANVDYTLALGTGGAASTVTVKGTSGADPEDYSLITGDRIEIQWIN